MLSCSTYVVYVCAFAVDYLFAVLADVRVDLIQSAQHVKLMRVEPCLLSQIRIHVLVADRWQSVNISVVSGDVRRR